MTTQSEFYNYQIQNVSNYKMKYISILFAPYLNLYHIMEKLWEWPKSNSTNYTEQRLYCKTNRCYESPAIKHLLYGVFKWKVCQSLFQINSSMKTKIRNNILASVNGFFILPVGQTKTNWVIIDFFFLSHLLYPNPINSTLKIYPEFNCIPPPSAWSIISNLDH